MFKTHNSVSSPLKMSQRKRHLKGSESDVRGKLKIITMLASTEHIIRETIAIHTYISTDQYPACLLLYPPVSICFLLPVKESENKSLWILASLMLPSNPICASTEMAKLSP